MVKPTSPNSREFRADNGEMVTEVSTRPEPPEADDIPEEERPDPVIEEIGEVPDDATLDEATAVRTRLFEAVKARVEEQGWDTSEVEVTTRTIREADDLAANRVRLACVATRLRRA